METDKGEIIPIDLTIQNFGLHLESHPRTILSAKFGDGKTFFLNEFSKTKDDFLVIRISPVNYQVADNNDIFELIKWDLLMQLHSKGILIDKVKEISTFEAFRYCLANNGFTLLENGADAVSKIPNVNTKVWGELAKSIIKLFRSAKDAVKDYKDVKNGNDEKLAEIFDKIEGIPVLECDLLTRLIQDSISKWKSENKGKRMVLVFDDMDRLDPSHLFRILNIVTAHVDYYNKYGVESEQDVSGCKFGVDNIVVVLDYDNLKNIYQHFYGPNTSIEGYIGKFADKGIFHYSITEEAIRYFYIHLSKTTQIDKTFIKAVIPYETIKNKSVRDLTSAMDNLDSQLFNMEDFKDINYGIFKLFVVLKRFGLSMADVLDKINGILDKDYHQLAKYTGLILKKIGYIYVSSGNNNRYGAIPICHFDGKDEQGFALIAEASSLNPVQKTNFDRFIQIAFSHIG